MTLVSAHEHFERATQEYYRSGKGSVKVTSKHHWTHNQLSETLFAFAYNRNNEKPANITIQYDWEQESRPITLYSLKPLTPLPSHETPLRVSLISMRHLALDHIVDFAWFLNKELTQNRTYVDTDHHCSERTGKLLRLLTEKGVHSIHVYHTGYQAAVIGFYRGLIEYLSEQRKRNSTYPLLHVTPYYFNKQYGFYRRGSTWC